MARQKKDLRDIDGVVLLDKPAGLTSNQALQRVKRLLKARKAGHTGSLDPLATGLLPLCFGEATKISAYLLEADKHYRTVARLGQRTDTADAEGEVIETRPVRAYTDAEIEAVLARFRGPIEQIPPMYSAVKQDGRRLYELARQGREVERPPRAVVIHALQLLGRDDAQLELDVRCSKGTYIRTLVEDIGEALGCGAHVAKLRRLGVAPYDEPEMVTLEQLEAAAEQGPQALDGFLMPVASALAHWPRVVLDADGAHYLRLGQALQVPGAPAGGLLVLLGPQEEFIGIGQILDDGRVGPKRLISQA